MRLPLTPANKITIFRLACIPLFVAAVLAYVRFHHQGVAYALHARWTASLVFGGIFFLDAVDGFIARVRRERTRFGAMLDPIADKFLVLSALILLSGPAGPSYDLTIPFWFSILVIGRDAWLIAGGAAIQALRGDVVIRPRMTGKASTFSYVLVLGWVLFGLPPEPFPWLIRLSALCTAVSAVHYTFDGAAQVRNAN